MVVSVRTRRVYDYGVACKTKFFSICGLSVVGGIVHNTIQICVASAVVARGVFAYLPYMMLAGAIAGFVTGILCHFIVVSLKGKISIDFKTCEYRREEDSSDE